MPEDRNEGRPKGSRQKARGKEERTKGREGRMYEHKTKEAACCSSETGANIEMGHFLALVRDVGCKVGLGRRRLTGRTSSSNADYSSSSPDHEHYVSRKLVVKSVKASLKVLMWTKGLFRYA